MPISKSLSTALIDGTGAITPANVTVSTNTMTVGTAMYVVANGNLGIGNTSPIHKLSVNGTLYTSGILTANGGAEAIALSAKSADHCYIGFYPRTANTLARGAYLGFGGTGDTAVRFVNEANGDISINNTYGQLFIAANGNVGINTSTPTSSFYVNGLARFATRAYFETGLQLNGNAALGTSGNPGLMSYEYPYSRFYLGDGSGYSFAFSKRSSSVTTDLFVIQDNSGNVGIGNTSPVSKLHVYGSGDPIIRCESSTSNQAGQFVAVGNGLGSYPGFSLHQNSTNYWSMQMRADTNMYLYRQNGTGNVLIPGGNLGVGVSSPSQHLSVTQSLSITDSGGIQYLLMGNQDSAGTNAPAIIRAANKNIEFGFGDSWSSSTGGTFTSTFGVINPAGTVFLKGGNVNAGGTGINFPATQSSSSDANTLDDYEEGSWTPACGTTGVTVSGISHAKYTKIGRFVHATTYLTLNNTSGGTKTYIQLTGLPFVSDGYGPINKYYGQGGVTTDTYIEASTTYGQMNFSSGSPLPTGASGWMFNFTYLTST